MKIKPKRGSSILPIVSSLEYIMNGGLENPQIHFHKGARTRISGQERRLKDYLGQNQILRWPTSPCTCKTSRLFSSHFL